MAPASSPSKRAPGSPTRRPAARRACRRRRSPSSSGELSASVRAGGVPPALLFGLGLAQSFPSVFPQTLPEGGAGIRVDPWQGKTGLLGEQSCVGVLWRDYEVFPVEAPDLRFACAVR